MNKSGHKAARTINAVSNRFDGRALDEKNKYSRRYKICSIQMPSIVTIKTGSDLRWDIKILKILSKN